MIGKVLTICAIGLVLIATLCIVFLWKGIMIDRTHTVTSEKDTFTNDVQAHTDTDLPVLPSMKGEFTFEPANIAFTLPEGWQHVPLTDAPTLAGFTASGFALSNEKLGCFLVYYDQQIDKDMYAQTGFGERTFAGNLQFDNQWYAPQEVLPEDFTFNFDKPQRFAREIYSLGIFYNTPTYRTAPQLILFERDGKIIPDACIASMKPLTESWKPYFKPTTLSQKSGGFIYAKTLPGEVGDGVAHLFFQPDDDSAPLILTQAPASWGRDMTFRADGTIEGITQKGTLSRFNVFTGSTTNTPPLLSSGEILSYHHAQENEWVLAAADLACLDKGSCSSMLYKKDEKGVFTLVPGGKLKGPTAIVGFIPEKQQLVLSSGYGDAGCSHAELYVYDEKKSAITRTLKHAGCADEPETPEQVKTRLEMDGLKEAAGIIRRSQLLRVEHGILTIADVSQVRESSGGATFVEDYSL